MLIAYVEHTEQQCRHQCHHHYNHRTLAVCTVVDVTAQTLRCCLRREQECIKGVVETAQFLQLAAFLEVLAELLPYLI